MTRIPIILVAASGLVLAQNQNPGWRRADAPPPAPPSATAQAQGQDPEPVDRSDAYGQAATAPDAQPPYGEAAPAPDAQPYGQPAPYAADAGGMPPQTNAAPAPPQAPVGRQAYGLPAELTIKPGTYVAARIAQTLSSSHNQVGDTFAATLAQPVVVDGVVVANRGQTVYGRVADVQKQKADRPSRLGLELTSITLADGTQVPVRSTLVTATGRHTPGGVQAGTVAATTGVGAIVGGAIGWGTGAAIGAGAGAVAGLAGVLLTRNHPTVVYPETALTFDVQAPVTISTLRAPGAFRFVGPEDYNQPYNAELRPRPARRPGAYYAPYGPYAYGYGYPYAYAPYPYWGWGPGFGVTIGGGGWYGGRGWYGRGWRR